MTLLSLLLACQDYDLTKKDEPVGAGPAIEVTPNPVIFAELPAGETASQAFTIRSVGGSALNVTAVTLAEGDATFALTSDGALGSWAPGESADVVVTFTSDGGTATGLATVLSNDASNPETYVDLLGGAVLPDLVIEPDTVNFGVADVGVTIEERVNLRNVGEAPLTVTTLSIDEAVFGYALASALPLTIGAGDSEVVTLTFTPDASGAFSGELSVGSNDPNGVEVARLFGSSGGQPVAVCDVDPRTIVADGTESADWIGNGSYDPSGYAIVTYDWRLVTRPSGSSASMPSGGANRRGFTTRTAGTYEAQLIVENAIGERSEPCIAVLEATEAPEDPPPDTEDPPPATEPIYLNTAGELYSFDPSTMRTTYIGDFEDSRGALSDSITDIAIDLSGNMYGVSFSSLYRIDPTTAYVSRIAALPDSLVGLTCLSDGRLVGAGDGVYFINTSTAAFTTIVSPGSYTTSGDIVGLPDGYLYWSVSGGDDLVVVDASTGRTSRRGSIGVGQVYGMAWYDGTLWGFTSGSNAVEIDTTSGRGSTSFLSGTWYGATTNPVVW